jgi:hypothetical protein
MAMSGVYTVRTPCVPAFDTFLRLFGGFADGQKWLFVSQESKNPEVCVTRRLCLLALLKERMMHDAWRRDLCKSKLGPCLAPSFSEKTLPRQE